MKSLYAKLHQKFWYGLDTRIHAAMDRRPGADSLWHILSDLHWLVHEAAYWTSPIRKQLNPKNYRDGVYVGTTTR
jgi:hypothetical protein